MGLSTELISQFAKITNDNVKTNKNNETTVYGTTVEYGGSIYVKLDGSDLLTPITTTADVKPGERVTVLIKNHTATVNGNISSPAARTDTVKEIGSQVAEFKTVIADKASIKDLEAEKARIDDLQVDNVEIKDTLTAQNGVIENLKTTKLDAEVADITFATIGDLEATDANIYNLSATYGEFKKLTTDNFSAIDASIRNLNTDKLDADVADITYATIENLEATDANIENLTANYGQFKDLTADKFNAIDGYIYDLNTQKLSAVDADLKYANIDFSNIGEAAIETLFAGSGLIKDLVVSDGTITGELVGVTIKGDLIEGNTIVAEKLVVKGEDGLYYKLNTDGMTVEAQQTEYNSLNGSVITAKSITATKISVDDLVAFGATIGGFKITENSIYSGVKSSVNNTTRGVYLDNTGQIAFGDSNNFLKYYKDSDGTYKLAISAGKITIGSSNKDIETTITEVRENLKTEVDRLEDEVATILKIESSRGTVFKNDMVSTVLTVVIYRGTTLIRDILTLRTVLGDDVRLQWYEQQLNDQTYRALSYSDGRIGSDGFSFTLSPGDIDTKSTFRCELIT